MSNQVATLTKTQIDFIKMVGEASRPLQKSHSILPSLTIAQAILESNWGKSAIGKNLFGIKATSSWKGKTQLVWTHEYEGGVRKNVQALFRDYDTLTDSLADHAKLLTLPRYAKVRAAKTYRVACVEIQKAGYATDPNYSAKLISLIENYKLFQYDEVKKEEPKVPDWRQELGEASIKSLAEKGLIQNPEEWTAKDLINGKIEPWMFFTLIDRLGK